MMFMIPSWSRLSGDMDFPLQTKSCLSQQKRALTPLFGGVQAIWVEHTWNQQNFWLWQFADQIHPQGCKIKPTFFLVICWECFKYQKVKNLKNKSLLTHYGHLEKENWWLNPAICGSWVPALLGAVQNGEIPAGIGFSGFPGVGFGFLGVCLAGINPPSVCCHHMMGPEPGLGASAADTRQETSCAPEKTRILLIPHLGGMCLEWASGGAELGPKMRIILVSWGGDQQSERSLMTHNFIKTPLIIN